MRINLIAFIIAIACINVSATLRAQNISVQLKNAPIQKAFEAIEKQSGYDFFYDNKEIKQAGQVTLNFKNLSLNEALKKCFEGQPLSYTIVDKTIIVKAKEKGLINRITDYLKNVIITGKVVDEKGSPLPGATIKIKGTSLLVYANSEGSFTISNVPDNATLQISYVGYETKEALATDNLIIVLAKTSSKLDDIQVMAYGTTTRRLNTGSISTVKAEDIERQPVSNPIATLQARVPGLVVNQINGLPGSGFNVQIRGRNSISQGTEPLYIIDGVPFDSGNPTQVVATGSMNVNNPFNTINPADIESIEVLKDADATSIYGSRGANGVILITTKKGKAGSLNIDIDAYTGWSHVTRTLDLMNGAQYRQLRREAFTNDGVVPTINNAKDLIALDSNFVNNWEDILYGKTATINNLNLRMSGGGEQTQFAIGVGYNNQEAIIPGDYSAGRKSLSLSINHKSLNNKFIVSLSSSYSYNRSNLTPFDVTDGLLRAPYGYKMIDANGSLIWDDANALFGNPLAVTFTKYNAINDLLNTSSTLSYEIIPGFKLIASGGFTNMVYSENVLTPLSSLDPRQALSGSASFADSKGRTWSIEPQINYGISFKNKIGLKALLGLTWQEKENTRDKINGEGYTNDALINTIAGATSVTATNDYSLYKYNAAFARLSFDYNQTYLLNVTGRRDGSSRFGPGNQFANFWSVGAAWIFSNESKIKESIPWLSFGKLRTSYGTVGNDQIGDYRYLDSYTAATNGYQQSLSLQPSRLFNKNYSWEQFRKFEAAIELGFLKDRIWGSFAFYQNRSANQLISYSLPTQTGFSSVILNFPGEVENKGWEFDIRSEHFKSENFNWSTSINLSIPKNKLSAYPGLENSSFANSYVIGQSLNIQRGYEFLGVDPQTGIYKFVDQNGDGIYDTKDYISYGTTDPKFYGGLQNNFQFKRVTLNFLFQFVKQTGIDPIYRNSLPIGGDNNASRYVLDYWKKPGDIVPYAKPTQLFGTELYRSYTLASQSSAVITDASFIRLKNVSLAYNLPKQFLQALHFKSFNAYIEGQNLLTITNYRGPDPEVQSTLIMPPLRTLALGIRAGF